MPVIVKMQRLLAGHPTPRDLFAALCSDQRGTIICGWDLTEPELLAHFDGGDVAYFEMDQQPDGSWIVLRFFGRSAMVSAGAAARNELRLSVFLPALCSHYRVF